MFQAFMANLCALVTVGGGYEKLAFRNCCFPFTILEVEFGDVLSDDVPASHLTRRAASYSNGAWTRIGVDNHHERSF